MLPAALLVAALIGFLLPFGTASCGTPVTFTGFELATASVPAQGSDEREMADMIESNGTLVAAIALVSIAVGLVLLALRVRGWGVAAAASLLALLLLPWLSRSSPSSTSTPDTSSRSARSSPSCASGASRRSNGD